MGASLFQRDGGDGGGGAATAESSGDSKWPLVINNYEVRNVCKYILLHTQQHSSYIGIVRPSYYVYLPRYYIHTIM